MTDRGLRLLAAAIAFILGAAAFALRNTINPRVQAVAGIICFISIVAVLLVPIAWFWYKWFWSKPTVYKPLPARTWPPNRSKALPRPRFVVPF